MVATYLLIAFIIFVEVFRRFVLSEPVALVDDAAALPVPVMAWFGCAYNVRLRTHLAFRNSA
jgi:TRAP-type C4-dicarboxylate transport system permease small subunit